MGRDRDAKNRRSTTPTSTQATVVTITILKNEIPFCMGLFWIGFGKRTHSEGLVFASGLYFYANIIN
jgi:hypothetical protein